MVELCIYDDGYKRWLYDYWVHRDNGPAILWIDGSTEWRYHGQRHRVNGPAVTVASGSKWWYWYDQEVTEYEHMMLATQTSNND